LPENPLHRGEPGIVAGVNAECRNSFGTHRANFLCGVLYRPFARVGLFLPLIEKLHHIVRRHIAQHNQNFSLRGVLCHQFANRAVGEPVPVCARREIAENLFVLLVLLVIAVAREHCVAAHGEIAPDSHRQFQCTQAIGQNIGLARNQLGSLLLRSARIEQEIHAHPTLIPEALLFEDARIIQTKRAVQFPGKQPPCAAGHFLRVAELPQRIFKALSEFRNRRVIPRNFTLMGATGLLLPRFHLAAHALGKAF
jgi:hypothetical protein